MTKHDFSDLTPPIFLWDGATELQKDCVFAAARWGAQHAAERLAGQTPAAREETLYIEGGVYSYDEGKNVVLFKNGKFLMFGWEVPLEVAHSESATRIDKAKIGKLVLTLPLTICAPEIDS